MENKHVGRTFPGFGSCKWAKKQCWQVSISLVVKKRCVCRKLGGKGEKKKAVFSPPRHPEFCTQQEARGDLLGGKLQVSELTWGGRQGWNTLGKPPCSRWGAPGWTSVSPWPCPGIPRQGTACPGGCRSAPGGAGLEHRAGREILAATRPCECSGAVSVL